MAGGDDTEPAAPGGGFAWNLTPGAPVEEPPPAWDTPTVATPTVAEPPAAPAPSPAWDVPTMATPVYPPLDAALEGVTEALEPQHVGLDVPEAEGPEVSAIDSLFGEGSFVEYEDGIIPALQPRASGGSELVVVNRPRPTEPREGLARPQKILVGVAAGLVALLLLVVMFLAGTRIAGNAPAPAAADPSPSATAEVPVVGPLPAGESYWDRLQGGECIAPYESAWADTFTVVDCAQPHAAQLLLKGTFPAVEDPAYPGIDALQAQATALCAVPTVIDYSAAAAADDLQLTSSFAADQADWDAGNRTFYCFANRAGGEQLATSIAIAQPVG